MHSNQRADHRESATESADVDAASEIGEDLVVVSNRQPYRHDYADERADADSREEAVTVEKPSGGLIEGLDQVMRRLGGTWVAWGDGSADDVASDDDGRVAVPPDEEAYTLQRVDLTEEQVRGYYDRFANQTLWPLAHSLLDTVEYDHDGWTQYRDVNERFADAVLEHADPSSTIWLQDYHVALAPRVIRERRPDATIAHFWHIPWPSPDVLRACPNHETLLAGLLGNDLVGVHVPRYRDNLLDCIHSLLDGATVDREANRVHHDLGTTRVVAVPLGVDADEFRTRAAAMDESFWTAFLCDHGIDPDTRVALGVDRLDYTKGIPERLDALEHLWETRPDLRGEFTYLQIGTGTRERVPAYQDTQDRIERRVREVTDRFETADWQPVVYTTEWVARDELAGVYRHSDVALVGPLRDGMNLVAQEYVAAQVDDDAALVLSELAGAHDVLGEHALSVNPYDTQDYAATIEAALAMAPGERRDRTRALRRTVHDQDVEAWLDDVFETIQSETDSRRD